jgi:hypothetical protein
MNEGVTCVHCVASPNMRTFDALMPFVAALLRLGASSVGWPSAQSPPLPLVEEPSPDPALPRLHPGQGSVA